MKYLGFANRATKNTDVEILFMLMDLSGSMDATDWKPSRKDGSIKAHRELIKVKAQCHPRDIVGIIGFGKNAEILHEPVCLDNGMTSLFSVLERLPKMGYTNFTAALELAEAYLCDNPMSVGMSTGKKMAVLFSQLLYGRLDQHSNHTGASSSDNNCLRRIILLTDGEHNEGGSPLPVASRLKKAGVVIDCIGIGGSPESVNENILKKIASRNLGDRSVRYCFIGDQQELIRRYEDLALHIRPV